MNYKWFQNKDNVVYADVNLFSPNFGKEVGINNFREIVERFKHNPTKEGIRVQGKKRTSVKLFIPDLFFADEEKLEMGDTVWVYVGEHYPGYCLYWPMLEEK